MLSSMNNLRQWLVASVLALCATSALLSQGASLDAEVERALASISPGFIKAHISFLGDDLLEGRRPGTAGYDIAARHVAASLEALGLQPAAGNNSFFQTVPLLETKPDAAATTVVVEGPGAPPQALVFGRDFSTTGQPFEPAVDFTAPLVFVGYGVEAPELKHDDYQAADVKGKIAVLLFGAPSKFPATSRAHYASGLVKAETAAQHGAVGIVWLASPEFEKLYPWRLLAADQQRGALYWVDSTGTPANAFRELRISVGMSMTAAAQLFRGSSVSGEDVFAKDSRGEAVLPAPLQTRLHANIASTHRRFESANVAAVYRGAKRADEYVVYSAHLDHLGVGDPVNGDVIYNGVLDNASGVAGMLAVAKAFSTLQQRPTRSVLFLAVTAEESGLIGSDYFARNPTVPANAIVANVNMDGLPLLYDFRDVISFGSEHSSVASAVQRATRRLGLELTPDPYPEQMFFVRSDQYSFVKQGVPAVFAGEGLKTVDPAQDGRKIFDAWMASKYHQPGDDLNQPLNFAAAVKGARLQFLIGYFLASDQERARWNSGDFFGTRFGRKP
jgi:Zn-dependent M28 family amino/carboxypeptidase